MAAIFQLRRGTTAEKPTLTAGELYVDQTSENLIVGVNGSKEITLLKLNDINTGSLHLTGDIRLSGSIYLGNETADNISALGVFTTNLVPSGDSTKDVGTTSVKWRNVYATNISGAIAATNGVVSGSSQLAGVFEEAASETHTLVSGSSQVIGILSSLNSFSASVTSSLDKLYESTASLNLFTASLNTSITNLNSFTESQISKNSTLATYTGSVESRFTALATISGSLILTASAHEVSITNLNQSTSSANARLNNLESKSASVDVSLTQIHSYTASLKDAIGLNGTNVTINGDLTVNGTTTQINSTQINIGENILELNYGGSATVAGLYTKDATGGSNVSGSLLWDSTNDYWKAGKKDLESKVLLADGDNVISSSLQLTELNSFTSSTNTRLELIETSTGSLNSFSSSTLIRLGLIETSTGSLNSFSSSTNTRLGLVETSTGSLNQFTESANTRLGLVETSTGSLNSFTQSTNIHLELIETSTGSLNSFSASTLTRLNLLETSTGSLNSFSSSTLTRLNLLETSTGSLNEFTSSQLTQNIALATITGSLIVSASQSYLSASLMTSSVRDHEERITYLEGIGGISGGNPLTQLHIFSASAKISIANLELYTSSADIRLNNLELTSASVNTSVASLNTFTQSTAGRLSNLETKSASVDVSLSNIHSLTASLQNTYEEKASATHTLVSGSSQIIGILSSLNSFTASLDATYATEAEVAAGYEAQGRGIVSGSTQIIPLLPVGTVSGSSQVIGILSSLNSFTASLDATYATEAEVAAGYEAQGRGIFSGSSQIPNASISNAQLGNSSITIAGTSVSLGGAITAAKILEATNVISSSTQITSLLPSGVVSGSSQIDLTATTNYASGILTRLNAVGVVSGSSQINLGSATGNITLATQTTGDYVASLVQGTGVTITNNSGENATPTIAIGQAVGTSANVQFSSIGVGTTASGVNGEIRATGDIVAYYSSDERLKENITPIENAVEKINQMGGYNYDWKEGFETIHSHKGHDLGVIAQEVQSVLPEVVTERETGYLAVDYVKLVPVLIEAIKELSAKIDRLENK